MTFKTLDNRNRTDFEKDHFAMLSAIKGEQFGRDVYSSVMQFKDLSDFLQVFPEVQRDINLRKVASIRQYILSGASDYENNLRFFSAVTVTCKGHMFYDDVNKRLAIDTNNSKLSLNDGQHRFEGIRTALLYLEQEFLKNKTKGESAKLLEMIDQLSKMVIPVVIFNGLTESHEKQLFHDLNNLAQRPSRNTNILLNQTDLYARMAREISEENRYIRHYGVEKDKTSIHASNPNTILLSTVYNSILDILHNERKVNKNFLTEETYEEHKTYVADTFDRLLTVLPHDLDTKSKYITDRSFGFRAISRFISYARLNVSSNPAIITPRIEDDVLFDVILKDADIEEGSSMWEIDYAVSRAPNGKLLFAGGQMGGYRVLLSYLKSLAKDYAVDEHA